MELLAKIFGRRYKRVTGDTQLFWRTVYFLHEGYELFGKRYLESMRLIRSNEELEAYASEIEYFNHSK